MKKIQTGLIKSELFFHYRKLTSIRIVCRLNKTFLTHFDCDYFELTVSCDSKQEAVEFLIKIG